MIVTWEEAIQNYKYPQKDGDTYRAGFRSGWLDMYLGWDSIISRTTDWGHYAIGYVDGHDAYYSYNPVAGRT